MSTSRREFITTMSLAGLASGLPWPVPSKPKLAFSTLGCPKWPWPQILDFAAANGYSAIELRGILGDLDLPKRPELTRNYMMPTKANGQQVLPTPSASSIWPRSWTFRTFAFLATNLKGRATRSFIGWLRVCANWQFMRRREMSVSSSNHTGIL